MDKGANGYILIFPYLCTLKFVRTTLIGLTL